MQLRLREMNMASEVEVNTERLIELVEARDCIWDISSERYKDKNLKKETWIEICQEIIIDFNDLDNNEKNKQCKSLQLKWKNVRERYLQQFRSEKNVASGSGYKTKKPYVYSQHLAFLKNIGETAQTTSSIAHDDHIQEDSPTDITDKSSQQIKPSTQRNKRSKYSSFEDELLKKLDMPVEENRHISFMKGILPALNTLTEDEILEWQRSVLETLYSIKKRKLHQNPAHFSGTQASSSLINQRFTLQPPPQNVNAIPDHIYRSQPMHYSIYQTCPQTSPVPPQSPVNSILSDTSSLLDI